MKRLWLIAVVLFPVVSLFAAGIPDFSGVWKIDTLQSPQCGSGYRELSVSQTPGEVRIGYSDETLIYRLDTEHTYDETNLGSIPGFARKVTTRADWDGTKLVLRTTRFNETTDLKTGAVEVNRAGMFTRVIAFTLTPRAGEMAVESSGYRDIPPAMLHGYPYDQKTDPVYSKFREIFRKIE